MAEKRVFLLAPGLHLLQPERIPANAEQSEPESESGAAGRVEEGQASKARP